MTSSVEWLLTGLLNHGTSLLGAALFLAAFGVPLPATMLLMAAGAFTRQGMFAAEAAVLAATIGAITGDACSYLLGRLGLRWLPQTLLAAGSWQQAGRLFARWGAWSVFVTRFLLTPAALPVNLLAGSSRYSWRRFMAAAAAGEVIWVLLFGGIGHFFSAQWEVLSGLAGDFIGVLLGLTLVGLGVGVLLVARRRRARRAPAGGRLSGP